MVGEILMTNELLWVLFLLFVLTAGFTLFALFGKHGLLALIVLSIVICNIQVAKTITLFGMVATLGNVMYAGIFWATDVLAEVYGKREAKRAVWLGFVSLLIASASMQIALLFKPDISDFIDPSLHVVFSLMPRIAVASLVAYLTSQLHDVWAFHFWKRRTGGKHLWVRNNLSTLASQAIDSAVFTLGAFWGVFESHVLLQIALTTYLLKVLVAVVDTPFIYAAAAYARRRAWVGEDRREA